MAIRWFIKAARMGHPRAIDFFRRYAVAGYAEAQVIMGLLYYKGQGVTRDYEKSVTWLRKAVSQGHNDAKMYMDTLCSEKPGACE
jgi:TPR repeat protein